MEIEPAFTPLISICTELPTPAGYLDNLWLTPNGGIVLGECKLFRNPQARREVVAQVLDYARALGSWSYSDLENAFRSAVKSESATLWEIVKDRSELEERQFIDAVERRLRQSRFLVLIIGDGIQEGVEALTSHLQMHAGLHVSLALVDLSIWSSNDGATIVSPRVPLKTVLIERGVVSVANDGSLRIEAPALNERNSASSGARAYTLGETEFYAQLDTRRPALAIRLRPFLNDLQSIGINPDFRRSVNLRWSINADADGTAGYIDTDGRCWFGGGWNSANRVGAVDVGERYLAQLASLVAGSIRRYPKGWPESVGPDGRGIDVALLLNAETAWKPTLETLVRETRLAAERHGISD